MKKNIKELTIYELLEELIYIAKTEIGQPMVTSHYTKWEIEEEIIRRTK